jgi:hypothetical protein
MKYTAIWQGEGYYERNWLMRLFEPYIERHVFDGRHEMVLDNVILFDAFVYAENPKYYEKFRGKNAFLVHVGDEFYELGVDRYVHFKGVFRTIWSTVFNPKHVMVLPLGYSKVNPGTPAKASDRRYAWSFIGEAGKVSRPDAVREMAPLEPHICYSSTPVHGLTFFNRSSTGKKRIPVQDFVQILGQSAFAPTPMGNGSLESCRVYDALEAGAIPIVERRLTLDYFRGLLGDHPLPTVSSWSAARRLAEGFLKQPEHLDALQERCQQWWKTYQEELRQNIGVFLEERSQASDAVVPLRSPWPKLPFWKYIELIRHHDLAALGRRFEMQAKRLLKSRKWREAHRAGGDSSPGPQPG